MGATLSFVLLTTPDFLAYDSEGDYLNHEISGVRFAGVTHDIGLVPEPPDLAGGVREDKPEFYIPMLPIKLVNWMS